MFTLVYTRDGLTVRHALSAGDTVVGRAALCDLAIDDPSISRRHVRFRIHGDHCLVTDLGGRNGTFLRGEKVSEAEVSGGDVVVLGRFPLRVEHAASGPARPADQRSLLESPHTVLRRVDEATDTRAGSEPAADPNRLLLLLTEISRQLVRWRPLPEILERIVSVAFDTIAVERAFLLLLDERTGEAIPRVARHRDAAVIPEPTVSRTVVRLAIDDRVAILASDATLETRFAAAESVHDGHIRSLMCAPLWNENTVIGVLYVDNPFTARLTAADLDVLQALSCYAAVAIEQARLSSIVAEETRQRQLLGRYHSAAVTERILASRAGADAALVAEDRDVSILFADIVGFTARAEAMPPSEVALLLNQCLGAMSDAVFVEEGTLDKFIGDAVLAVFGAPLDQPDHAARALRAAAEMHRRVAALALVPPVTLRIAINSGIATVGDIGTPRRREYTVLGDVVNTCSRLVSSECAPGQTLLTAATRARLTSPDGVVPVGCVSLRGRGAPVDIFAAPLPAQSAAAHAPAAPQNE